MTEAHPTIGLDGLDFDQAGVVRRAVDSKPANHDALPTLVVSRSGRVTGMSPLLRSPAVLRSILGSFSSEV